MSDKLVPVSKPSRLTFIDMARSIAILLMLEGHFIDLTLGNQFRSPVGHFENPDFLIYDIWHLIRGYTSPLFLTVTGMVFVYLLYRSNDLKYRENERVKKGFSRVLLLLAWGYMLSPNSAHILQCIGIGIGLLLAIYGIYKLTRFIPLWVYYFLASFVVFSLSAPLRDLKDATGNPIPWPANAPDFIQDLFYHPKSTLFPIIPNLGYTFFGAALGVLLHAKWINHFKWNIPGFLLIVGLMLAFYSTEIVYFIKHKSIFFFGVDPDYFARANWLLETQGWILIVLGILSVVDRSFKIKQGLFLKIGQNTLVIFIVHMILLYGCITHFLLPSGIPVSISDFFSASRNPLNPYAAAIGAALFILVFVLMIKYLDKFAKSVNKVLGFLSPL